MTYRVCDKCTKEAPASETHKFALNGYRYEIDLCEKHGAELYGQIMGWADAGTLVGEPTVFDKARPVAAPVTVLAPRREEEPVVPFSGPTVRDFADRWGITKHARERMAERKINLSDALWAAERPEQRIESLKYEGMYEHIRGGVGVVVNSENSIVTVFEAVSHGKVRQA